MIVKNLEESIRFYRDVLGFSEVYHVDFPVGCITIMKSPDGACVELIESPHYPVGLYSIGTDVDNLDEALERLKSKSCEPIGEVTLTSVGRQVFIMDPNGVRICLIEHDENYKKLYLNNNK
jgi:lactoylglutathione lyase